MRDLLKVMTKKTPLYLVYRYFLDRHRQQEMQKKFWEWSEEDRNRIDFYKQFITTGDIVFDIGANMGNRAKVFYSLGAVVIAVEPQTQCATFLQAVFTHKANFHLVRKALGCSVGQAEMFISNAHVISSLSTDWIRAVQETGRFKKYEWNRKEMVLVDTLDNLVLNQAHI